MKKNPEPAVKKIAMDGVGLVSLIGLTKISCLQDSPYKDEDVNDTLVLTSYYVFSSLNKFS